jgi:hypothetical protein
MLPKVKWLCIKGCKIGIVVAKSISVDVVKGIALRDIKN